MTFLYYLPQFQGTPTIEKLHTLGLGYAFDEGGLHACKNSRGPDGSGGMVVATRSCPQSDCMFDPGRQKWRTIPKLDETVWVGMWTDHRRPKPEILERQDLVLSVPVTLEDGNEWKLPIACRWEIDGDAAMQKIVLPRVRAYTDDGRWEQGQVVERCRHLWGDVAVPYMQAFADAIQAEIDKTGEPPDVVLFDYDIDQLLVECLQHNYRVGPAEISMLEAFTSKSAQLAGDVLINASWYLSLQKKIHVARQDTSNSSLGPEQQTADV